MLIKGQKQINKEARALCEKFINKVETGRARSVETYAECKSLLALMGRVEERYVIKSGS